MKEEIYQNLIKDMYLINLYAMDANCVKKQQIINDRYTTIHGTMLAIYLYFKWQEKTTGKIAADGMVHNALMTQLIHFSTGNIGVEMEDGKQLKSYHKVKQQVVKEKIAYLSRNLKELEICLVEEENEEIYLFFEQLADLWILMQLYKRGNFLAVEAIRKKVQILTMQNKIEDEEIADIQFQLPGILEQLEDRKKLQEYLQQNEVLKDYDSLAGIAFQLREVYRYSQTNLRVEEDVLYHIYINTVMCVLLADWLTQQGEEIDGDQILLKSCFHDFSEYTGNEIIASMKAYSEETTALFKKIEDKDERKLKESLGPVMYTIIREYKKDKNGYVVDIIDKMIGIMKVWIEETIYGNKMMLKCFTADECKRFQRFYTSPYREELVYPDFYTTLLKSHYIAIMEDFLAQKDMNFFWNREEIQAIRESIEEEKRLLEV